jgi:DNA-binding MarR family transcriptional regulator
VTESRRTALGRHRSAELDDALAFRIHRTNRLLRTHLARFLQSVATGLTPEQWFVLARLARRGAMRQVDLAEPVLADPPNVSRLVDALVGRGHVAREPDPSDRRSWLVSLTPAGAQIAETVQLRAVAERHAVFAGFDGDELDALAAMLDRIDANVRGLLAE